MTLRTATLADAVIIHDLAHRIWPHTFKGILSEQQLAYMLERMYSVPVLEQQLCEGIEFLIPYHTNEPVGYLGYEVPYEGKALLKIHKIYLLPQMQGSGYGRQLMQAAERVARERGVERLTLNVNRYNQALGFYKKMGYRTVCEEDIDIGQGYLMEDFRMEKILA